MAEKGQCQKCGAPIPAGSAFCESCGTEVGPGDAESTAAADHEAMPPAEHDDSSRQRRTKRHLLLAAGAVLLLAGVGVGGYLAGHDAADDSERVAELQAEVDELSDERDKERDRARDAEQEVDELREEVAALEERMEAELGLRGQSSPGGADTASPADADLRLGEAGAVGDLILKPTSFEKTAESGDTATYRVTITAKNNGSEPVGPFCGGSGAELEDAQGRTFDGDSVLSQRTRNCGNDLQPGLTAENYAMEFNLPSDARPALIRLSEDFDDSTSKTWSVE